MADGFPEDTWWRHRQPLLAGLLAGILVLVVAECLIHLEFARER